MNTTHCLTDKTAYQGMPPCEFNRSVRPSLPTTRFRRGFTLVELMVVIVIVAVLASMAFMMATRATEKAESVEMVNRMRQTGTFLFSSAADNSGTITVFVGGNGHRSKRLISHVASGLGFDPNQPSENKQTYQAVKDIVYTPATDPGKYDAWKTFGVNMDDNERLGVRWIKSWVEDEEGTKGRILKIRAGSVRRASSYPLIADSSNEQGVPRLRFANDMDHKFAMRFGGKGSAFFLDGSARLISPTDMGKYGITNAYLFENGPSSRPTLVKAQEE